MKSVKELVIKVLPKSVADLFVKRNHYSGKIVQNSQLHLGVFWNGKLHGVMQFGPSLDKRKIISLVKGTRWNEFIELNRMVFDEALPRNSESRAISVAMKLLRKNAPHIKWVVSFADAAQCGDGTIYRAAGFVLTGINICSIYQLADGRTVQRVAITARQSYAHYEALRCQKKWKMGLVSSFLKEHGGKLMEGYSLRYIYFIDRSCQKKLTVPEIPFEKIKEAGASMYKGRRPTGEKVSRTASSSE